MCVCVFFVGVMEMACNIDPRKIHVEPPKNGGLEDVMFLLHCEIETVSGVYDDASSWNG